MLPAPKSDGPLPPRPESTAPILGSPLWASAPPGPLRPSCCPAFPGLALRPSISASASRSPQVGNAPGHGGAPAQHPALQQLLRVYSGALTPRMLCAGYLDQRADACQVRAGGGPVWGGRGLRPGARLTSSPRAGRPGKWAARCGLKGGARQDGIVLEAGPPVFPDLGSAVGEWSAATPPGMTNCLLLCVPVPGCRRGTAGVPWCAWTRARGAWWGWSAGAVAAQSPTTLASTPRLPNFWTGSRTRRR